MSTLIIYQLLCTNRSLLDQRPRIDEQMDEFVIIVRDGQMECGRAQVFLPLDHIHRKFRVAPQQNSGQSGMQPGIANDQNVQQGFSERAAILHLPTSLVILPLSKRVKNGGWFDRDDDLQVKGQNENK